MSFASFVSMVLQGAGPASAPVKNSLPPGRLFFLPVNPGTFSPAAESHGVWPGCHPTRAFVTCCGLCPWGSTSKRSENRVYKVMETSRTAREAFLIRYGYEKGKEVFYSRPRSPHFGNFFELPPFPEKRGPAARRGSQSGPLLFPKIQR